MTPAEYVMYGLLAASVFLLVVLVARHMAGELHVRVAQWREARRRKPDEFEELRTENIRLQAEHAMMARRLELRMARAREEEMAHELARREAENRAGQLARELRAERDLVAELKAERARLAGELSAAREEMTERRRRIEELRAQRTDLSLKLEEAEEARGHAWHKLARARRKLDEMASDMRRQEQELKALRRTLRESGEASGDCRARVESLRDVVRELRHKMEECRRAMTAEEGERGGGRAGASQEGATGEKQADSMAFARELEAVDRKIDAILGRMRETDRAR